MARPRRHDTRKSAAPRGAAALVTSMLVLALFAAPASAQWRSWTYDHNAEPNVGDPSLGTGDHDPTVMWSLPNDGQNPTFPLADRLYFDAILDRVVHPFVTTANPEGASMRTFVATYGHAYLGYWRDCNLDGFVGDQITGSIHYPVTPTVSADVCPVTTPYNDGTTVSEFLTLGPNARDLSTSGDAALCPERNGGPSGSTASTPRADDGRGILMGNGGSNILCMGGRAEYVQDDYAKVWQDIGLPAHDHAPPEDGTFVPFPDGTMRDTNGHFRLVDLTLQGLPRALAGGLWPARSSPGDPAPGAQCGPTDDAADPAALLANAEAAVAQDMACSPVPNVAYADLPVLGPVAWPGHLVEDRFNNSERADREGTPITEPFDRDGPDNAPGTSDDCTLETDVSRWDDDPDDADPFYGGDPVGGPTAFVGAYVGPHDDGPSVEPTFDRLYAAIIVAIDRRSDPNAPCTGGRSTPVQGHPLEDNAASSVAPTPLKVSADSAYTFSKEMHFNPNTGPGVPVADTHACVHGFTAVFGGYMARCGGQWLSGEQFVQTHGVVALSPDLTRTWVTTAYADVSFGRGDGLPGSTPLFDVAGDGPFRPQTHGVWDPPIDLGLVETPWDALPAGLDDAHQYGDEQCGEIDRLGAGDELGPGSPGRAVTTPTWSCDRTEWAAVVGTDCTDPAEELSCYLLPKVGDPFDLRDIDCFDNDVLVGTTDTSGPLPSDGIGGSWLAAPGLDCDALGPTDLPGA